MEAGGTIDIYHVRLIVKGFNYFDTYSSMSSTTFVWILIATTSINNLEVYQMNVKKTFLNDDLDEEVYMK
jgi:hypothetical protein